MGAIPGMSAIATWMMKSKIAKAQIPGLSDLQEIAQLEGVKFVACKMTIDMMGLKQDDFIEGVVIQTAEEFLKHAKDCKILLYT
jgi:peroxiredoxin family protein